MLKKLCSILLALFLVVCTSPIAFAEGVEGEIPSTSTEIETVVEEKTAEENVEVNAAAPAEEQPQVQEEKVETSTEPVKEKTEETKTEVAPEQPAATKSIKMQAKATASESDNSAFQVTYNVYYRSEGHGQVNGWVKGATKTISVVNGKSNSSSTAINVAYRQMTGNRVADRDIRYNKVKYRFNGNWADENGNSTDPNGVAYTTTYKCNGSGYDKDTIVNIYAQYDASPLYDLKVNYEDKLGNTSSSWGTVTASASGYKHTFKEAQDVPENYQFCYWQSKDNNETYEANSELNVDIDSLDEDTVYSYLAMYQPAVIVNYYVEEELVESTQSFEEVKVYDYTIDDEFFDGWYNDNTRVENEQVYDAPEITSDGDYLVINVLAKFIEPEPIIPTPDPGIPGPDPTPEPVIPTPTPIPDPEPEKPVTPVTPIIPGGGGDGEGYRPDESTTISTAARETPARAMFIPGIIANNEETDDVAKAETINDIRIPLAKTEETWAVVNLVCTVVTVVVSLILVILGWYNRWRRRNIELDEEHYDDYQFWLRNKIILRIVNILIAIISIGAFILTENIFLKLVFIDRFTPLMVVLAILAIGVAFFSKYVVKEYYPYDDDEDDEE